MNILMFSITPLFPDHDMGGGQKHLRTIALHLAEQGHEVRLFCTRREIPTRPFTGTSARWCCRFCASSSPSPRPTIRPPTTSPRLCRTSASRCSGRIASTSTTASSSFPTSTATSRRWSGCATTSIPETTQGAFHFEGDTLITISEYARQFFLQTVGRFFPELPSRMKVIRNSIDWEKFQPTKPRRILNLVPSIHPELHTIVLHPHRPEDSKGIWQTIEVADRLVKQYGFGNLRVLVPRWLNVAADPGVQDLYARVEQAIDSARIKSITLSFTTGFRSICCRSTTASVR